ncbi:MAG: hypothetical protein M5R40_08355 [Anaerolineae bacterium]|nr:hypothetical protein [Anaerolineae bacterium]
MMARHVIAYDARGVGDAAAGGGAGQVQQAALRLPDHRFGQVGEAQFVGKTDDLLVDHSGPRPWRRRRGGPGLSHG